MNLTHTVLDLIVDGNRQICIGSSKYNYQQWTD